MENRATLRQQLRQARRAQTHQTQQQAAAALAQHFSQSDLFKQAQHIAVYMAVDAEMDPNPLLQIAWQQSKTCYLPILRPDGTLIFSVYQANDPLIQNRFKIPEPNYDPANVIAIEKLDLVLIPLVGFDLEGNRLGMGAGFYDRTFAFKKRSPASAKPFLIGLAYELQQITDLVIESWDVPLNAIATEKNIYKM